MACIYNSFYRMVKDGTLQVMPAPVDKGTPDAAWHAERMAAVSWELARVGFTHRLWPVLTKSQGGSANNADGYGHLDDYDLGSKDQSFGVPTRWGTREAVQRAIAVGHAAGLMELADMVIHQYDGGNNRTYEYPGADGRTKNGRFPKHASCFVGPPPCVPIDPVFDSEGNVAFGDLVSYVNSTPKNYMRDGMIEAIRWQVETLGLDGFRLDDAKGENAAVSREILSADGIRGLYCFGECFTGDPSELEAWVQQTGGLAAALDFGLHFTLQAVADRGASCRTLDRAGFAARDAAHAVTFVDTADTDNADGEKIVSNKLLCYAYLLTIEGTPMVYARDYLEDPFCYGLKPWIDNLLWINRTFAFGRATTRFVDDTLIVLSRDGDGGQFGWSGGLLTAINFESFERTVTVETGFGAHRQLHDYTGHARGDVWTNGDGTVTITVPGNYFGGGQSYCCFAAAGVGSGIAVAGRATTQTFFGAVDLDIGPAVNGTLRVPQRISCAKGSRIGLAVTADRSGWEAGSEVTVEVTGADGRPVCEARLRVTGTAVAEGTAEGGWHTLTLTGTGLPNAGSSYELRVTYTGAQ